MQTVHIVHILCLGHRKLILKWNPPLFWCKGIIFTILIFMNAFTQHKNNHNHPFASCKSQSHLLAIIHKSPIASFITVESFSNSDQFGHWVFYYGESIIMFQRVHFHTPHQLSEKFLSKGIPFRKIGSKFFIKMG